MTEQEFLDLSRRSYDELPEHFRNLIPRHEAWAIHPHTRKYKLQCEIRRRHRLAKLLGEGIDIEQEGKRVWDDETIIRKRDAFNKGCAADPRFMIDNVIWTRDPEGYMGLGGSLPLLTFEYAQKTWLENWIKGLSVPQDTKLKQVFDKTRRIRASIYRMAFEFWAFTETQDSICWMARESDTMVDNGLDWNSLFGKFRHMWHEAHRYYPWKYPRVKGSSRWDQDQLFRYPEKMFGSEGADTPEHLHGNELSGCIPSTVGLRGGAAKRGCIDEAGFSKDLDKFMDSITFLTTCLDLISTPPEDISHPFAECIHKYKGWNHYRAWWGQAADKVRGVRWNEQCIHGNLGPVVKYWRTPWLDHAVESQPKHIVARNECLDYASSGGQKVFISYSPEVNHSERYDLFDERLPLMWWCDVGAGDLWAWWAIQWSDITGEVNVIDYFSQPDVTVHWFMPVIGGWDWNMRDRWKTAPERVDWKSEVPWPYSTEDIERMAYWRSKRGVKVEKIIYDFTAASRGASSQHTVYDRLMAYGYNAFAMPMQHRREKFIDHANEVLPRVRISKRLIGKKPRGVDPSCDEVLTYWRRLEATEAGRLAVPKHDVFSHGGTAFLYGCQWIQPMPYGVRKGGREHQYRGPGKRMQVARRTEGWHSRGP